MPEQFFQKPVNVEVARFVDWGDVADITQWLHELMPLFVPRGYPHDMRKPQEKDRSTGEVLDEAPPYMVLRIKNSLTRVDQRNWIVRFPDRHVEVFTDKDFNEIFDKNNDVVSV